MTVNRYKIRVNSDQQKLIVPIGLDFDDAGREDLIKTYEDDVLNKVIGKAKDYEVTRYRHADNQVLVLGTPDPSPPVYYKFYFHDPGLGVPTNPASYFTFNTAPTNESAYETQGFTRMQMYQNDKAFKKSFFKLDFYDTPNRSDQTLYMSLVLNTTMSIKKVMDTVDFNNDGIPDSPVVDPFNINIIVIDTRRDVNIPEYMLTTRDEGYYLHWLKSTKLLNIDKFYMSAKFYNGLTGKVVKFTNTNPAPLLPTTQPAASFFYEVPINTSIYTYEVHLGMGPLSRVGLTPASPIEFYEWTTA